MDDNVLSTVMIIKEVLAAINNTGKSKDDERIRQIVRDVLSETHTTTTSERDMVNNMMQLLQQNVTKQTTELHAAAEEKGQYKAKLDELNHRMDQLMKDQGSQASGGEASGLTSRQKKLVEMLEEIKTMRKTKRTEEGRPGKPFNRGGGRGGNHGDHSHRSKVAGCDHSSQYRRKQGDSGPDSGHRAGEKNIRMQHQSPHGGFSQHKDHNQKEPRGHFLQHNQQFQHRGQGQGSDAHSPKEQNQFTPEEIDAIKAVLKQQQRQRQDKKTASTPLVVNPSKKASRKKKKQEKKPEGPIGLNPDDSDSDKEIDNEMCEPKSSAKDVKPASAESGATTVEKSVTGFTKMNKKKGEKSKDEAPSPKNPENLSPLELFMASGFDISQIANLSMNEKVNDMMLIAKEDGNIVSCQPNTVGEVIEFKRKYPSAQAISYRAGVQNTGMQHQSPHGGSSQDSDLYQKQPCDQFRQNDQQFQHRGQGQGSDPHSPKEQNQFTPEVLDAIKAVLKQQQQQQDKKTASTPLVVNPSKKASRKKKKPEGPIGLNPDDSDSDKEIDNEMCEPKSSAEDVKPASADSGATTVEKSVTGFTKMNKKKGEKSKDEAPSPKKAENLSSLELFMASGCDISQIANLSMNEKVNDMMLIAKEDGNIVSCQPNTVGEVIEFKRKFPSAQAISYRAGVQNTGMQHQSPHGGSSQDSDLYQKQPCGQFRQNDQQFQHRGQGQGSDPHSPKEQNQFTPEVLDAIKAVLKQHQQQQEQDKKTASTPLVVNPSKKASRKKKKQEKKPEGPIGLNPDDSDSDKEIDNEMCEPKSSAEDMKPASADSGATTVEKSVTGFTKMNKKKGEKSKDEAPSPKNPENLSPLELFMASGFDISQIANLSLNEKVKDMVLIAKEDGNIVPCQPNTVGEVIEFKRKYPNAQAIIVKTSEQK